MRRITTNIMVEISDDKQTVDERQKGVSRITDNYINNDGRYIR